MYMHRASGTSLKIPVMLAIQAFMDHSGNANISHCVAIGLSGRQSGCCPHLELGRDGLREVGRELEREFGRELGRELERELGREREALELPLPANHTPPPRS